MHISKNALLLDRHIRSSVAETPNGALIIQLVSHNLSSRFNVGLDVLSVCEPLISATVAIDVKTSTEIFDYIASGFIRNDYPPFIYVNGNSIKIIVIFEMQCLHQNAFFLRCPPIL